MRREYSARNIFRFVCKCHHTRSSLLSSSHIHKDALVFFRIQKHPNDCVKTTQQHQMRSWTARPHPLIVALCVCIQHARIYSFLILFDIISVARAQSLEVRKCGPIVFASVPYSHLHQQRSIKRAVIIHYLNSNQILNLMRPQNGCMQSILLWRRRQQHHHQKWNHQEFACSQDG